MRYFNLIYAKHHPTDRRAYLYALPLGEQILPDDRIAVTDKRGEHIVTATHENFYASKATTKMLCEANGGYFPPAAATGVVDTVTVRQEIVRPFSGGEPLKAPADIPF